MKSRSSAGQRRRRAEIVVSGAAGSAPVTVALSGERVTVGRLPDVNDVVLQPDPQLLVTRAAHCTFELEGARWLVVDGGSVNGTFVRRGDELRRVKERAPLHDGDVVCVLAAIKDAGDRTFFELAFHDAADSQATRPAPFDEVAPAAEEPECLSYDLDGARLVLVQGGERHELHIRAQAHRLVRHMVERNAAAGGSAVLCAHDELMDAVWAGEPMHTRVELAKLVWELRKKLEPFGAEHLIENERRLGYRMRTCAER
jgi:FHA domain/Transcriptional regulatory protein, C terminal